MLSSPQTILNAADLHHYLANLPTSASPQLVTAIKAAANALNVIQDFLQNRDLVIEFKQDASPVTAADKAAEQAIRQQIKSDFPEHSIFGEEYGRDSGADDDYLWLIDPIDGTKCFIRQLPFYSIQIALMHKGEIIMGVSCAPLMKELAHAEKNQGAFLNGKPLHVSDIQSVQQCYLSTGNLKWSADSPYWPALAELFQAVQLARGYGDFFSYHKLASGQLDAVIEEGLNILDIAALAAIVQEAGGTFTDLEGEPLSLTSHSVLAAATPELHHSIQQRIHNA